jgi:hypothetical protein
MVEIGSMAPMTKKGCKGDVVLTRLAWKSIPPDGGSPEMLVTGTRVGVAQVPGVTPRVEANICARAT